MIRILIDGREAVTTADLSIKWTRENPFLTDNGDYTYDVNLPLRCKANRGIFGFAGRADVSKGALAGRDFDVEVQDGPRRVLTGTGVVTAVSQEVVKMQILGGNSELNYKTREGKDIYIDELDLGKAEREESPYGDNMAGLKMWLGSQWMNSGRLYTGRSDTRDCVYFPVLADSEEMSGFVNNRGALVIDDKAYDGFPMKMEEFWTPTLEADWRWAEQVDLEKTLVAPQPYLCVVAERVLGALGYTVKRNGMRETWMKDVFMVNTVETNDIARMLPHWTAAEFMEQVKAFYGLRVTADGLSRSVSLERRSGEIGTGVTEIADVVDAYETNIDREGEGEDNKDSLAGNIAYSDFPENNDYLAVPPETYRKLKKTRVKDRYEMERVARGMTEEERAAAYFILEGDPLSREYILHNYDTGAGKYVRASLPVNVYGMLQRNADKDDADFELKILPARVEQAKSVYGEDYGLSVCQFQTEKGANGNLDVKPVKEWGGLVGWFYRMGGTFLKAGASRAPQEGLDVDQVLAGGQSLKKEGYTGDTIEVAVNDGRIGECLYAKVTGGNDGGTLPKIPAYARATGQLLDTDLDRVLDVNGDGRVKSSFTLKPNDYENSVYGAAMAGVPSSAGGGASSGGFDTDVEYVFEFLSDETDFDMGHLFLIRNRLYVCKKIETTITQRGVSRLKKGYFYEYRKMG